MTACNNNVRGGKASRVITAALVATLSVGTPMAAIASTVSEGGVDMLATDQNAFAMGTVNYKSGKPGDVFTYDGTAKGLVPETVSLYNTNQKVTVSLASSANPGAAGYYYYYVAINDNGAAIPGVSYVNAKGEKVDLKGTAQYTKPVSVGNYAVVLAYWDGSTSFSDVIPTADTFSIVGTSLDDAVLCSSTDASDTTFAWDGVSGDNAWTTIKGGMAVAIDGVALNPSDYSIDNVYLASTGASVSNLTPGTEYKVQVTGNGAYDNQEVYLNFTYGKLDLSTAEIDVKNGLGSAPSASFNSIVNTVNGKTLDHSNTINAIDVTLVSTPDGKPAINDAKGGYTFKLSAKSDNKYVTGSTEVTVTYADKYPNFSYDGTLFSAGDYTVDLSAAKVNYFDSAKVTAVYDTSTVVDSTKISLTYLDKDGNEVAADSLKTPGTWYVKASVNFKDAAGKLVANSQTLKVITSYNVNSAASVFVAVDGQNVDATTEVGAREIADYTGEAQDVSVKVTKGAKTFAEGTDYTVQLQKKSALGWEDVDDAIDAGTYKVTVKGGATLDEQEFPFYFKIAQCDITKLSVKYPFASESYYAYTGEKISPVFEFSYTKDSKQVKIDVPADCYEVEYKLDGKTVDEVKDEGTYAVTKISSTDANKNFNFTTLGLTSGYDPLYSLTVKDDKVFADVANDAYYAEAVSYVKKQTYMNGYAGTDFFGPEDTIVRHQVATILYNIASTTGSDETDPGYSETSGWDTGFNDVDGNMYYAKQVAWAHQAGLVSGYGDGNFGPEDNISREQFAQMLFNFAKKSGLDMTVDTDSVLAGCADGASVSDWAREAVAWCVDNGLMGQGSNLMPTTSITRAQAAIMVMRFDGLL